MKTVFDLRANYIDETGKKVIDNKDYIYWLEKKFIASQQPPK